MDLFSREVGAPSLRWSGDLGPLEQSLVGLVVALTLGLLLIELKRRGRQSYAIALTGALGALLLGLAVLRPVQVAESGLETGARVVVLVDESERMTLPSDDDSSRRQKAAGALGKIREHFKRARVEVFGFGSGALGPLGRLAPQRDSELLGAIERAVQLPGDRPSALVVLSDGRLTTPGPYREPERQAFSDALERARKDVPVHTVAVTTRVPVDMSIRAVRTTGTAVAHQAFPLTVEVGCEPRGECPTLTVVVRELLENGAPEELARGEVTTSEGLGVIELPITLERAGGRVIEIALSGHAPDEVPANDRRFVSFEVRRDRMRILHVAGRPTYDVRALRMFLKGDESIDLISFFILRTLGDRVGAVESELALIPFPVDELFTEHLPSFDAIILQDIDAREYQLDRHFLAMRDYVKKGGGLILVGGPGAFAAGGYAESPLEEVLPVAVPLSRDVVHQKPGTPGYTAAGLVAPMLAGLREHLDARLPRMAGANRVGAPRRGALVLWEHPELRVNSDGVEVPMPLLALAEMGDGRSIALAVDGTHKLRFGELGAEAAGRAHTALWEGLLGWLMRDQRYEAARIEGPAPCFAGLPFELRVTPLPLMGAEVELSLAPLSSQLESDDLARTEKRKIGAAGEPVVFSFAGVPEGAYVARSKVGEAPPTRLVFACEKAGGALSDSRPDPERLEQVARLSEGRFVAIEEIGELPRPPPSVVLTHSSAEPVLPDWFLAALASLVLAGHWWLRRWGGFL